MTGSSVAGVITAVATVLIALGGVITAVGVLLPILRGTRQIHKIVNQQRTDMENFQRALIRALTDAGVPVPVDQSLPPVD
jgi:Flp pilus assembly protein TadB